MRRTSICWTRSHCKSRVALVRCCKEKGTRCWTIACSIYGCLLLFFCQFFVSIFSAFVFVNGQNTTTICSYYSQYVFISTWRWDPNLGDVYTYSILYFCFTVLGRFLIFYLTECVWIPLVHSSIPVLFNCSLTDRKINDRKKENMCGFETTSGRRAFDMTTRPFRSRFVSSFFFCAVHKVHVVYVSQNKIGWNLWPYGWRLAENFNIVFSLSICTLMDSSEAKCRVVSCRTTLTWQWK